MPTCAIVSFRLGLSDGVSIVADRWAEALNGLGYDVFTVAGEGPVDELVPGLAIAAPDPPDERLLSKVLARADLVVVENLCSIPLNLTASRAVGRVCAGRPTIMHHHDPPWQRERFAHIDELPLVDPAWRHVTINELTRMQMADRGIEAITIYNPFDTHADFGDRETMRSSLGVDDGTRLVAHPVRAIQRKNIPVALRLAEALEATYWLLGQSEDGYDEELDWLLSTAAVPFIHRGSEEIPDIYAASDAIVFPSIWEGFGNPPIEASLHRRPVIVGSYAVAEELRALGFHWFDVSEVDKVAELIINPDDDLLDHNRTLAMHHFSIEKSQELLAALITEAGWS